MQILVVGMHRSGTSAVARLVNMMGAYFAPENLATSIKPDNPKGHWERRDVIELHQQILASLQMSWDNVSELTADKLATLAEHAEFIPRLRDIIFNLETQRPWLVKDPRLCLLLPLWKPLLEVPICVYIYRNPIQVAKSLRTRDKFPIILGVSLWEKYNLDGLIHTADMPRVFLSHEDLLRDPVATVTKLYQNLSSIGVQGLHLPSEREITAFIDPALFHERSQIELQRMYLNQQQFDLLTAFQEGDIAEWTVPALSAGAAEVLHDYHDKLVTDQKLVMYQAEVEKRDEEIVSRDVRLIEYHESVLERNARLAECQAHVATQEAEISHLQQQVTDFAQVVRNKEMEIAKYQTQANSYRQQWQVTKNQVATLQQERSTLTEATERFKHDVATLNNQLQSLQTQLTEKLAENQKNLANKEQQLRELLQWVESLGRDIDAVFQSLTWRSGNVLTQIALKLLLRKPDATAKDHIETILRMVASRNYMVDTPVTRPQSTTPRPLTSLPARLKTVVQNYRDYPRWIKQYDTLTPEIVRKMQQQIEKCELCPTISIVMPTFNTDAKWLRAAIDSVIAQIYPYWELCIADDASTAPHVRPLLEEYANRDQRLKVHFRETNGHISVASNNALEMVTGDFVTFLDHDDTLAPHALFWVVQDIHNYPDALLWYSDEDKIDKNDKRQDPYFKCDWNPDLFLSHNLITHLAVYRTDLVREIGGFREGYEGAQDYDLALRALERITPLQIRHIPRILYHWRIIAGSTASRPEEKPYALAAAHKAIGEFLEKQGYGVRLTEAPEVPGTTRVQYLLPSELPLVSLIIPTHNGLNVLQQCVDGILHRTDYQNIEIIIVDNASDDAATLAYLQQLRDNQQARILDYPYPFNYADINNHAVAEARGEIIGLINNDIEVITPDWLSEMVSHALRPEVGAVGARLWYPNETLQHGGVVLGIGGVAGHAHKGFPRGHVGYMGRAALIQNFSAVTGACMVMRKAVFEKAGGLNADNLAIALNDVDFCLKLNELNLRVVWTPYAELYHHESVSRGYEDTPEKIARFEEERSYMKERWGQFLALDPAYSPNLTLETEDFAFAWPPRVPGL